MNRQRRRQSSEKIEIALEKGQMTAVLVGSVVALGLVFLLGVGFGSRTAAAAESSGEFLVESGDLAAKEGPELTFHDALTSVMEGGSKDAPAPAAEPAGPAVASPPPERDALTEHIAAQTQPKEPAAAVASVDEGSSSLRPQEVTRRSSEAVSSEGLQNGTPTFAVQVSSSRDQEDTRRLVDRLREAGWEARIEPADIEGRGRWYRVRVGRYETRDLAMRKQAELQLAFNLSGLVVSEQ